MAKLRLEPDPPSPASPAPVCLGAVSAPLCPPVPTPWAPNSLLALVQHKGPGVIVSRHGDDRLTLKGPWAGLVHCVAGDGGRGVACPVECVPAPVIGQAFHRAHVCGETGAVMDQDRAREQSTGAPTCLHTGEVRELGSVCVGWPSAPPGPPALLYFPPKRSAVHPPIPSSGVSPPLARLGFMLRLHLLEPGFCQVGCKLDFSKSAHTWAVLGSLQLLDPELD